MGPRDGAAARRARLRVGGKFTLAVGVLVLALVGVAAIGWAGLVRSDRQLDHLYDDNLRALAVAFELAQHLHEAEVRALQLVPVLDPVTEGRLDTRLDVSLEAAADRADELRPIMGDDEDAGVVLDGIDTGLAQFSALRRTGVYRTSDPAGDDQAASAELARRTVVLFRPMAAAAHRLHEAEQEQADAWRQRADRDAAAIRRSLVTSAALSLLGGVVIVLVLHRDVVPRIRRYADFATAIAGGRTAQQLEVRGADELAELGLALNAMVGQRAVLDTRDREQMEFVDTLQMTSSEDEAHELIKRHTERSLPGSTATVLQSNNSTNRLLAATAVPAGSAVAGRLVGAEPRSCLAVRFARTHDERPGASALLQCGLCGGRDRPSTCEPLLVGGSVIGAVVVEDVTTQEAEAHAARSRIRTTVSQAAPVLANLRNLAVAEFRANNDSLTGLANRRATDDTLKRFVAQANRSLSPLTAAIFDLDHFKQINDRFGHACGDEVLAAVGAALTANVRESDFVGRFGGEEFLVLLPDTEPDGAVLVAEKVRAAVATVRVPGVEQQITASVGIADLLAHGGTAASMLREADRALYAAKAGGRDRTVVAGVTTAAAVAPAPA